jgi:hypothetical protein
MQLLENAAKLAKNVGDKSRRVQKRIFQKAMTDARIQRREIEILGACFVNIEPRRNLSKVTNRSPVVLSCVQARSDL